MRCHGERVVGAACPHCGAKSRPGEVNANVVRRRQQVARVEQLIASLAVEPERGQVETITSEGLTSLLRTLLDAIEQFVEHPGPTSNQDLALAIHRMERATEGLAEASVRRPGLGARIALHSSSAALLRLWGVYRSALVASTPLEAQALAKDAQRMISAASAPIGVASDFEAAAQVLEDEELSVAERIFAALRLRRPSTNLQSLMQICATEAEVAVGLPVGRNSGLAFATLEILGDARLDPRALRTKLRVAAEITDTPMLGIIAAMDGALPDLAGSRRDVFEAFFSYQAVLKATHDKRALVRQTGQLIAHVYEAAQPVFAWYTLLLGTDEKRTTYTSVVNENAANLATRLAIGKSELLFSDAPRYLRDAPNHGRAFKYDEQLDEVSISLGSFTGRMQLDDYVDRALAFIETVLAAAWGLENALECAGIPIALSASDASFMGLTPVVLTQLALSEAHGLTVRESSDRDGTVRFVVEPTERNLLIAAYVTASALTSVASVVVLTTGQGSQVEFDYARWPSTEGSTEDQMVSMISFLRVCKVDDGSALTRAALRYAIGCLAHALSEGSLAAVVQLRQMREWARERGWRDEAEFCGTAIGIARQGCSDAQRVENAEMVRSGSVPVFPQGGQFVIRL